MKYKLIKIIPVILITALMATGCSQTDNDRGSSVNGGSHIIASSNGDSSNSTVDLTSSRSESENAQSSFESKTDSENASNVQAKTADALKVGFGDRNKTFTLHLYDNATAAAIARHVGTADWQLPIYHYDDYENWEVLQYYDVPSRYDIPSNAESVSSEKAGEVYYSEPNRIVLFYGDAQVSGEYTKVGYFDFTEEFKSAVENNPVVEGWGNKLVFIKPGD